MLRNFRYAVLSFTALLVLSLGFALIPAEPPPPAEPPFSEQARTDALGDALELRTAAGQLSAAAVAGGAGDTPAETAIAEKTVTLLTLQARALLPPRESSTDAPATDSPPQPDLSRPGAVPATPLPTVAGLAAGLSASGAQRLADAAKADGGMARLLAGIGTGQLLAAENVAAAAGIALEALPHRAAGTPAGTSPSAAGTPAARHGSGASAPDGSACPSLLPAFDGLPAPGGPSAPDGLPAPATASPGQETTGTGTAATLGGALGAAAAVQEQNVYGYQAALPRLAAKDAPAAAAFLAEHEGLTAEAAAKSRAACIAVGPRQPGYLVEPDFLAAPVAGLARLEVASLPAFGDIIALADDETRGWAVAALQGAARRAIHWGGDPGPVPGILLDQDRLPDLPAGAALGRQGSAL